MSNRLSRSSKSIVAAPQRAGFKLGTPGWRCDDLCLRRNIQVIALRCTGRSEDADAPG